MSNSCWWNLAICSPERQGPLSAGDIARHTGLASASVTALVDRLERRGFATRRPDPTDRRRVLVEARADGLARFAPYFAGRGESRARLHARYTVEELAVILDFLERSTERLRDDTARLTGEPDR